MGHTLTERLTATAEGMRLYQQERAILEITELVCQLMQEQGVSRVELARKLGKTKGYVTQLLDGRTNMTVRTISDVFTALGRALHFQSGSLHATTTAAALSRACRRRGPRSVPARTARTASALAPGESTSSVSSGAGSTPACAG